MLDTLADQRFSFEHRPEDLFSHDAAHMLNLRNLDVFWLRPFLVIWISLVFFLYNVIAWMWYLLPFVYTQQESSYSLTMQALFVLIFVINVCIFLFIFWAFDWDHYFLILRLGSGPAVLKKLPMPNSTEHEISPANWY